MDSRDDREDVLFELKTARTFHLLAQHTLARASGAVEDAQTDCVVRREQGTWRKEAGDAELAYDMYTLTTTKSPRTM